MRIGIDSIHEGYDGFVGKGTSFTLQERIELADYAIALWTQFKEQKIDEEK